MHHSALLRRTQLVELFVAAKRSIADEPGAMLRLLDAPDLELAVRSADCMAALAECYASQRRWADAYAMLIQMRTRGLRATQSLSIGLLRDICDAMGAPVSEFESSTTDPLTAAQIQSTAGERDATFEESEIDEEVVNDDHGFLAHK